MAKITVVGSFVMDNVAHMPSFPAAGQSVIGTSLGIFPGGKGANQCVSVKRLGGDVEMAGMLGNDANGQTFREIFRSEGIPTDFVFTSDKPTAIAQIQIDKSGQNRICVIPSANYEFGFEHLEKIDDLIKNTQMLILQMEMRFDVTFELIKRAHAYGVTVLLNPAPAAPIPAETLALVDYITPNETELSVLTGMPTGTDEEVIAAANKLLNMGVKNVIATVGSRGATVVNRNGAFTVPAFKVQAVDTVAAGDSFNGALAVALTEGKDLYGAVRFANAMGALTVTKSGAIPSLHYREDVEAFLKKQGA